MKNMIKKIAAFFLTLSLLASVSTAYAAEPESVAAENTFMQAVSAISHELQAAGTSVKEELMELKDQYLQNAAAFPDKRSEWLELAQGVDTLIADCSETGNGTSPAASNSFDEAYLKTAVAAVVSWFAMKGYQLSSELLVVARNNTDEDRIYVPSNRVVAQNSSVVRDLIKAGRPSGSGEFPASGNLDLYYSIHLFEYTQTKTMFVLTDIYDYEHGDQSYGDSIAQVAVDTMADAQAAGIIVPYNIRIDVLIAN